VAPQSEPSLRDCRCSRHEQGMSQGPLQPRARHRRRFQPQNRRRGWPTQAARSRKEPGLRTGSRPSAPQEVLVERTHFGVRSHGLSCPFKMSPPAPSSASFAEHGDKHAQEHLNCRLKSEDRRRANQCRGLSTGPVVQTRRRTGGNGRFAGSARSPHSVAHGVHAAECVVETVPVEGAQEVHDS